jgi:outer membrane protein TolC
LPTTRIHAVASFVALATLGRLVAQDPSPPLVEPIRLSLEDALRLGRENNLDLRAQELNALLRAHDLRIAEAVFEPEVFGRASVAKTNNPSTNVFQPQIVRRTASGLFGLRQRIATGALYEFTFTPLRTRQTASIAGFPAGQYSMELAARVTQPLLRGGWSGSVLSDVRQAEAAVDAENARFRASVQTTLLDIVRAYWELVFALGDRRVNLEALDLALEQLRITNERIRVQELAERDRVFDEADVARRKEALIRAENEIRRREDALRSLLFGERDPVLWSREIEPLSPIETAFESPTEEWQQVAATALARRPDLRALEAEVTSAELRYDRSVRDVMPRLDLVGEYSSDGTQTTSIDAWRDVTDLEFPDWSLGLEFSFPIGNTSARAARDRAMVALEQARRRLRALEVTVLTEVRTALRDLTTAAEAVRAAAESVRLAETQLDTSRELLRVGRGTIFEVQQRNQELLDARQRLLRNQLDYRIGEAQLRRAQGLLEAAGSPKSRGGS